MSEFGRPYVPYERIDSSGLRTKFPRAHGEDPKFRLSHYRGYRVLKYSSLGDGTPGVDVDFLPDAPAPIKYSDFYGYISYFVPYPNPEIEVTSFTQGIDGYSNDTSGRWSYQFSVNWVRDLEPILSNDLGTRPSTTQSFDAVKVTWWAFVEDGGVDVRNDVNGTLQVLGTLNWSRSSTTDSVTPATDQTGSITLSSGSNTTTFTTTMVHGHGDNVDNTYEAQPNRDYYIEIEVTKFAPSDREIEAGDPSNMVIAGYTKFKGPDSYHDVTVFQAIDPRIEYKDRAVLEGIAQIRRFSWDNSLLSTPQNPATINLGFSGSAPGYKTYYAGSTTPYDGYHPGRERANSDHLPTDIHNDINYEWTYFDETNRQPTTEQENNWSSIRQTSYPLEHRKDSSISYDFDNDVLFMLTAHDGQLIDQSVNNYAIVNPIGSDETQTLKLDSAHYYEPRLMRSFGSNNSRSLTTNKVAGVWASWATEESYAFIGDPGDFNLGTSHFTIDGKFKFIRLPGIPSHPGGIISKRSAVDNGWGLFVDYDDKLKFTAKINATDVIQVTSSGRLASDIWYHFAVFRDSSGIHLIVNGELQQSNTEILSSESLAQVEVDGNGNGVHLELGRLYSSYVGDSLNSPDSGGGTWEAYIDEIRIVDKAMYGPDLNVPVPTSSFSQLSSAGLTGANFAQSTGSLSISGMADSRYNNFSFRQEVNTTHELYDPSEILIASQASDEFLLKVNDVTLSSANRFTGNTNLTTVQGGWIRAGLQFKYMPAMNVYWEIDAGAFDPSTMFIGATSGTFSSAERTTNNFQTVFSKSWTAKIENPAEEIQPFTIRFYEGTNNSGTLIASRDGFIIYGEESYAIESSRVWNGGWGPWQAFNGSTRFINEREKIQIKYHAFNVISPENFKYIGGDSAEPDGNNVEFNLAEYLPDYSSTGNSSTTTAKNQNFPVELHDPRIMQNGVFWYPSMGGIPTDLRTTVIIQLESIDDSLQGGVYGYEEAYLLYLSQGKWPAFPLQVKDYYEVGFYVNENGERVEDDYSVIYRGYEGGQSYLQDAGGGSGSISLSGNFIKFNQPFSTRYQYNPAITYNGSYSDFNVAPAVVIQFKYQYLDNNNWVDLSGWRNQNSYSDSGKIRFRFNSIEILPGIDSRYQGGVYWGWTNGREVRAVYRYRTQFQINGYYYAWSSAYGGHWRRLYTGSQNTYSELNGYVDQWRVVIKENFTVITEGLDPNYRSITNPRKTGTKGSYHYGDINCRGSTQAELASIGITDGEGYGTIESGDVTGYDLCLAFKIGFASVGDILKVTVSDPEGYTTGREATLGGSLRPPFGPQPPKRPTPPITTRYVTITRTSGPGDPSPYLTVGGINMGAHAAPDYYSLFNNQRTATRGYGNRLHARVQVMNGEHQGDSASNYRWTVSNPRDQDVTISNGQQVQVGTAMVRKENTNIPWTLSAGAKWMYGAQDARGDVISTDVWWYSTKDLPAGIIEAPVNYGHPPGYWYSGYMGDNWYWTKTTWTYYPAYTKTPIYVTSDGYFDGTQSGANRWYPKENHQHFEDVSFTVNVTDNRNYHYNSHTPMPLTSKGIECVYQNTTPVPVGEFDWTGSKVVLESDGSYSGIAATFTVRQDEYEKQNGQIVPASVTTAPGGTPVKVWWRGPNNPSATTASATLIGASVVNLSTGRTIPYSMTSNGGVIDTFNSDGSLGPFRTTWTANKDPLPAGKQNYMVVIGGQVEADAISPGKPFSRVNAGVHFIIRDDVKAPLAIDVNSPTQGIEYGSWAPGGGNFAVTATATASGGSPSDDGYTYTWEVTGTTGNVYGVSRDAPNTFLVRNNIEGKGGSVSYTVTVKDSLGDTASASGTATITIIGGPTVSVTVTSSGAQQATAIAPVIGGMSGGASWSASVNDADGDVTYEWYGQLVGTGSNITTGSYSGQGTANYGVSVNVPASIRVSGGTGGATWSARCTVTDSAGNTASDTRSASWNYVIEDPAEDDTPGGSPNQCSPGWYYVPELGTCVPSVPPDDFEDSGGGDSGGGDSGGGDSGGGDSGGGDSGGDDSGGGDSGGGDSGGGESGPGDCGPGEEWNPIMNRCQPIRGGGGGGVLK